MNLTNNYQFSKMDNYNTILLALNVAFSAGGIAGASVLASQNEFYSLSSAYGFYWFVTVLSFVVGVSGGVYHLVPSVKETVGENQYGVYIMSFTSFTMLVFWLSAASSVANLLQGCLYIKNRFDSVLIEIDNKAFSCDGEIIMTTFGFADFIVWGIVSFFVFRSLYNKLFTNQTIQVTSA
jgi:hypothetical protein